jgi:hypothetical protein
VPSPPPVAENVVITQRGRFRVTDEKKKRKPVEVIYEEEEEEKE